jgi:hypothetical protein
VLATFHRDAADLFFGSAFGSLEAFAALAILEGSSRVVEECATPQVPINFYSVAGVLLTGIRMNQRRR